MTSALELRRNAAHEAGHALVAFALGVPVQLVTIEPTDVSVGHTDHDDRGVSDRDLARISLGGMVAEAQWSSLARTLEGSRGDREELTRLGYSWLDPDLHSVVRTILRQHERALDAIVAALLARRTLVSADLEPLRAMVVDALAVAA